MEKVPGIPKAFPEDAPSYPYLVQSVPFEAEDQKNVMLLMKVLLKRAGVISSVLCTPRRLSVAISERPPGLGSARIMNILSGVMAVAQHMKDVYEVGNDFGILIDFWATGYMETTLGKATAFARKMKEGLVATGDFCDTFDFRIG